MFESIPSATYHAAWRAQQRAGLSRAELIRLWICGRDVTPADHCRFRTWFTDEHLYRIGNVAGADFLLVADANLNLITIIPEKDYPDGR